jgi:hypothetical protein
MGQFAREPVCGTYYAYRRGCRCEKCQVARRAYKAKYKKVRSQGVLLSTEQISKFIGDMRDDVAGELLKVDSATVRKWRLHPKKINRFTADEYAIRLGVHPSQIWGQEWYRVPFNNDDKDRV